MSSGLMAWGLVLPTAPSPQISSKRLEGLPTWRLCSARLDLIDVVAASAQRPHSPTRHDVSRNGPGVELQQAVGVSGQHPRLVLSMNSDG